MAPRAPALRAALGTGSARPAAAVGLGRRCGLAQMAAFVGPRQLWIEEKLEEAFSPVHMEVMNESHGRVEDECALARPHARARAPLAPGLSYSPRPPPCRRRSHFKVVVVSDSFLDKRLVARHRLVNGVLADESGGLPFHSLSIAAAKTPEEWGVSSQVPASPKCVGGDGSGLKR